MAQVLRPGSEVELDEALRAGAMGEIETSKANKIALRGGVTAENVSTVFGRQLALDGDASHAIEQLQAALSASLARVIDVFREWDEDGNSTVSKREFRRVLPMLGFSNASREQVRKPLPPLDYTMQPYTMHGTFIRKMHAQNLHKARALRRTSSSTDSTRTARGRSSWPSCTRSCASGRSSSRAGGEELRPGPARRGRSRRAGWLGGVQCSRRGRRGRRRSRRRPGPHTVHYPHTTVHRASVHT